jgi:pimeloyl-ACP methyl ester carboxylesterase
MTDDRPTLLLIHGMYLNGSSWGPWVARAEAAGFRCAAPSWPFHDGEPAERRVHVNPALGKLSFAAVTDHLKAVIDDLPSRPVLIGHSIGGLLVQKLANDGYARAGVAISSAPPRGVVTTDLHFLRANFPHLNPFAGTKPVHMTPERFHYAFANSLSRADSDAVFETYVVPESRTVPRSTLTSQGAVDMRAAHVPLLFLTGDADHLTPASLVQRNVRGYRGSEGSVEFEQYVGRSHLICLEPGWEEVADRAISWAAQQVG